MSPSPTVNELFEAAKVALTQMCRASAPDNTYTDSVDRLDAAIEAARKLFDEEAPVQPPA